MATCFLKQKTSAFTWKRYENFTEGLTPRQEPGVEQADQPENLSVARQRLAATHVGNYALFAGGRNNYGFSNVVDAYNTSLEKSTPTPLSQGRDFLAATHVGNYALFGGGYYNDSYFEYSNVVDAYDISLNRITPTPNPTPLSVKRRFLAATHVGNYALFGGGFLFGTGAGPYMSTVDAYDLSLNRTTATHLSVGRSDLAATNVGNYALFGGGNNDNYRDSNTVDAYDSLLNKVNTINLSRYKVNPVATHVGNYALFAGHNYDSDDDVHITPTIDAYDTPLNRITIDLPEDYRNNGAATHIGDYALFAGGMINNQPVRTLDTVYVYNSSLERSSTQNLDIGKARLAATHVGDYALFAGGFTDDVDGNYDTSTVDAYQENQEVCDFPVIPNSIYKFEPYDSETTASEFSKVTVNYPVNGYAKYMSTTLN